MAKSSKGGVFEREMCKRLSEWWEPGRNDIFWRSAGSGAMAKTRSKAGGAAFGQYGDIQATDPIGQPLIDVCSIELKRGYSKISLHDLFDKKPNARQQELEAHIQQAAEDRKLAGSPYWLLIARRDKREPLILFNGLFATRLRKIMSPRYKAPSANMWNTDYFQFKFTPKEPEKWWKQDMRIHGTTLDNFLNHVTQNDILKLKELENA